MEKVRKINRKTILWKEKMKYMQSGKIVAQIFDQALNSFRDAEVVLYTS